MRSALARFHEPRNRSAVAREEPGAWGLKVRSRRSAVNGRLDEKLLNGSCALMRVTRLLNAFVVRISAEDIIRV